MNFVGIQGVGQFFKGSGAPVQPPIRGLADDIRQVTQEGEQLDAGPRVQSPWRRRLRREARIRRGAGARSIRSPRQRTIPSSPRGHFSDRVSI